MCLLHLCLPLKMCFHWLLLSHKKHTPFQFDRTNHIEHISVPTHPSTSTTHHFTNCVISSICISSNVCLCNWAFETVFDPHNSLLCVLQTWCSQSSQEPFTYIINAYASAHSHFTKCKYVFMDDIVKPSSNEWISIQILVQFTSQHCVYIAQSHYCAFVRPSSYIYIYIYT